MTKKKFFSRFACSRITVACEKYGPARKSRSTVRTTINHSNRGQSREPRSSARTAVKHARFTIPTPYTPSVEELTTCDDHPTPHLFFFDTLYGDISIIYKSILRRIAKLDLAEILHGGPHQKNIGTSHLFFLIVSAILDLFGVL